MKKIIILITMLIFFNSFVTAELSASTGYSGDGNSGFNTNFAGNKFELNTTVTIISITKMTGAGGDDASQCIIYNQTPTQIANGSFVGDICTLDSPLSLEANNIDVVNITLGGNQNGEVWTGRLDASAVFPVNNIIGKWLGFVYIEPEIVDGTDNSYVAYYFNYTLTSAAVSEVDIDLILPLNDTFSNTLNQEFNFSLSNLSISNVTNCSLYTNETGSFVLEENKSISGSPLNDSILHNFSSEGRYIWNIGCFNNSNLIFAANNFSLIVDQTFPTIVTTTFKNNSVFAFNNFTSEFTFFDNNLVHSVNITIPTNNSYLFYNESINKQNFKVNITYNVSNLIPGNHYLKVRVADGHTAKKLKAPQSYKAKHGLLNDYTEFEFEAPYKNGRINIKQKDGSLFDNWGHEEKEDRYKFSFKPNNKKSSYTFEVEAETYIQIVEEQKGKYKKWLIYEEHWLDFMPYNNVDIVRINDNKVEVIIYGVDPTLDELVFDSIGDLNILIQYYNFTVVNATETYNSIIYQNINTDYNLNIEGEISDPDYVKLELNGVNYSSVLLSSISNLKIYKNTITPYFVTPNATLINHKWHILFDSDISNITDSSSFKSQIYYNISVGKCVSPRLFPIFNITYYDQSNSSKVINATNNYDLGIYDGYSYYNQTSNFEENTEDYIFCTNINPDLTVYNWNLWNNMEISKTGYSTRFYNIPYGASLLISNNPVHQLKISLVNESLSSTVQFTWTTQEFQNIDGTMIIYLCNPDGTKTLTDSISIVNGKAVSDIILYSKQYSYQVVIGATTYNQQSFSTCHQEVSTDVTYRVNTQQIDLKPLIGLMLTKCKVEKKSNTTANMTFNQNSEDPTNIEACLQAYKNTNYGLIKFQEYCENLTGGTIDMTITDLSQSFIVKGVLKQNGREASCRNTAEFYSRSETSKLFGNMGLLAALILIGGLTLFYMGKAEEGSSYMGSMALGIIICWFIGILSFQWISIASMLCFIGLISYISHTNQGK